MRPKRFSLPDGREVLVTEWDLDMTVLPDLLSGCVLWTDLPTEHVLALQLLVPKLVHRSCPVYVCVGTNSEWMHDTLDLILERLSLMSEAVTTWHDGLEDAFDTLIGLNATGRTPAPVLLVSDGHDTALQNAIEHLQ